MLVGRHRARQRRRRRGKAQSLDQESMDFRDGESTAEAEPLRLDFEESCPCLRYITAERYWSALSAGSPNRRTVRRVCYCSGCCQDDTLNGQLGLLASSSFSFDGFNSVTFNCCISSAFRAVEDSNDEGPNVQECVCSYHSTACDTLGL